jgi:hypothetical protein
VFVHVPDAVDAIFTEVNDTDNISGEAFRVVPVTSREYSSVF